ncbi:BrnT family toxin [Devosia sediminis]|uniref:BrnT family toxin n=1 Tax=Devosia sediminis TaxID=2798801 RepID=A0A934MI85_9HYPH|nr:BrnT family toxin [Devosia sediminis]MBJ3785912.1 BrnT family toxin [Devosia sediminis]
MDFEWDEAKNEANKLKHGIGFERAIAIFDGRVRTIVDTRFDYGETRQISFGMVDVALILAVVHTDRHGRVRIISARRASAKERLFYEGPLPTRTDQ